MCVSFEPTYEELKPTTASRTITVAPRFEPTYEELKPEGHRAMVVLSLCFEPTYEELKRLRSIYYIDCIPVLSLPMRN